jgi:molybdopterin-guanine dinucleotide biosynthesis protein A
MTSNEMDNTLKGIVLAGGNSQRMGQDKGAMQWHGMSQRDHVAGLLSSFCSEVFISCRAEQELTDSSYPLLADTVTGIGPYGAILSAFEKDLKTAWLVVACDLPLLDEATLQFLIKNRDRDAIATTFESPHDGLPEPLITIWEPAAYPFLLAKLEEGIKCPRKALMQSDNVTILKAPYLNALMNANTPADAAAVLEIMRKTPAH